MRKKTIVRLVFLTFLVTAFGWLLSRCNICSTPFAGVCHDWPPPSLETTEIVAYMGKDGAVYFDIPARKNYQRAELVVIGISRLNAGSLGVTYWSMTKRSVTDEGKLATQAQDLPLPLRYGQGGDRGVTKIYMQPRSIENGKYEISGEVRLYGEKGKKDFELVGRFRYENGAVRDYDTE